MLSFNNIRRMWQIFSDMRHNFAQILRFAVHMYQKQTVRTPNFFWA